jgi:hypothetical protein
LKLETNYPEKMGEKKGQSNKNKKWEGDTETEGSKCSIIASDR